MNLVLGLNLMLEIYRNRRLGTGNSHSQGLTSMNDSLISSMCVTVNQVQPVGTAAARKTWSPRQSGEQPREAENWFASRNVDALQWRRPHRT